MYVAFRYSALHMTMANGTVGTATKLRAKWPRKCGLIRGSQIGSHWVQGTLTVRYSSQGVMVTNQLHLAQRLWSRAILPLPSMPSWCMQGQFNLVFSFSLGTKIQTPGHNIVRLWDIHVLSTACDSEEFN